LKSQHQQFEVLFNLFAGRLVSFAQSYVGNIKEAEGVVHDCFLAIWEKRDSLALDESLKSYLYSSVKNKSLNVLQKRKLFATEMNDGTLEVTDDMPNPLQQLSKKETERMIFDAIERLPPKCKRVFLLSRTEHLSYKEIASLLDINTKTVENQIAIALKFIRESMGIKKGKTGGNLYHLPSILFLF